VNRQYPSQIQNGYLVKFVGMYRKIQKLLETRIQALQLLLMKFGLKLNAFESILNLSKRGILCITLAYKLSFL
jgi:hypothetical protein